MSNCGIVFEAPDGTFSPAEPFEAGEERTRFMSALGNHAAANNKRFERIEARLRRLSGENAILKRLVSSPAATVDELVDAAVAAIEKNERGVNH